MEAAHIINTDTNLIGISSSPPSKDAILSKDIKCSKATNRNVGVIMFNAGYLHHVGPNRINTLLARSLSESGFHTLRMDFSGLGDSGVNPYVRNNAELVNHDAKAAMDFMQSNFGCTQFVLFGLCSGALDSIHIAQNDQRVAGVVAVDGLGFRTKRFYLHHFTSHIFPRLFRLHHLKRGARQLQSRLYRSTNDSTGDAAHSIADDGSLAQKSRQEVADILQRLANNSTKMRFIYTGGVANFYNYTNQFRDMFGKNTLDNKISWRYFPQADHLFMLTSHRNQMLDDVKQWVCNEFN